MSCSVIQDDANYVTTGKMTLLQESGVKRDFIREMAEENVCLCILYWRIFLKTRDNPCLVYERRHIDLDKIPEIHLWTITGENPH